MRVHWTQNAIEHLVNIYEYITLNSPTYAKRIMDRITRRSEQIAEQPLSGRKVPEYQTEDIRELIGKPYRFQAINRRPAKVMRSMALFLQKIPFLGFKSSN